MDTGTMDRELSIVIIDDHPAVVAGIGAWCSAASPPIAVLDSGDRPALAFAEPGCRADVVVLDLQLRSGPPALDDLERMVDAHRRVVVYSQHTDTATALRCLDIGAASVLTKIEGNRHLISAVHAAANDLPYTAPSLGGAIVVDDRPRCPVLSDQERAVLTAWFQSDSKRLVADRLHLSPRTVATYIDRVRIKYANTGRPATSKAALVARALQDGLVTLDDL